MCDVCGNLPEWLADAPAETLAVKKKRRPKKQAVEEEPVPPPRRESPPPRPAAPPVPRPVSPPPVRAAEPPASPIDDGLMQYLKAWRSNAAQKANVPAYIVLSDAALVDLCRKRPANLRELLGVTGIGERKAELYGSEIFAAFEAYQRGARAAAVEVSHLSPGEETMRLLAEGKSFTEIAQVRGRQLNTVVNTVADLIEKGKLDYRSEWVGAENERRIEEAVDRLGSQWLKPLREALPAEITYEQIRLVVAWKRKQEAPA